VELLERYVAMALLGIAGVLLIVSVSPEAVISIGGWQVRLAAAAWVLGLLALVLPSLAVVSLVLDWMQRRRQQRSHAN
jgi:hypothetical protein